MAPWNTPYKHKRTTGKDGPNVKKWILLAVMALFVITPIVFWAQTLIPGLPTGLYLYDAGRFLALIGFVFVFFQFVFSSRIKWIERGIGLDKIMAIHRTTGIIGLVLVLIHPVPILLSDIVQGLIPVINLQKLVGATTLTLIVVAAGSALLYRRLRMKYETWKTLHWANYVALPIGLAHSLIWGSDLVYGPLRGFWFALAASYVAIVGYKLWNRGRVRRNPYPVTAVTQETHDTWSVHLDSRPLSGKKPFDYKPGQFSIVRLIRRGHVSEPHPFTLSSSPSREGLSVSVKSVGDFTSTIKDTTTDDRAYIDAPYGVFSFLNRDAPNLVFIAGGIGITPFMSMLRYMRDKGLERNVFLIWGNKTERDIAFRDELDEMATRMPSLRIVHVMSSQEDWPGEKGYVNAPLLQKYIGGVENPQVFLCGPPVMMAKIIRTLRDLGVPRQRIHFERFALR
jgi:predicted ferric reductase